MASTSLNVLMSTYFHMEGAKIHNLKRLTLCRLVFLYRCVGLVFIRKTDPLEEVVLPFKLAEVQQQVQNLKTRRWCVCFLLTLTDCFSYSVTTLNMGNEHKINAVRSPLSRNEMKLRNLIQTRPVGEKCEIIQVGQKSSVLLTYKSSSLFQTKLHLCNILTVFVGI